MNSDQKTALSALEALCSKREYCISEIRQKALTRLEGKTELVQEIIDSLINESYIDESRYASAFAREKSAINGWGPIKIRYALITKGIPADIISEALEEIDSDKSLEKLKKALEAKRKSLEGEPYYKLKLTKFALSKGYSYEAISSIVNEVCRSNNHTILDDTSEW